MRKKLIEVALPLEAINKASAWEKGNPFIKNHPRNLHHWWARRPLATARAVIFAQMVDDPSSWPEVFPTEQAQEEERQRLFRIIEELVLWESTTNERVLDVAREEIKRSWRRTCEDNKDHQRATELFDQNKLPIFHDPFAGGGALPLEAQRLGLEAFASDLNPVAVLINKAMIEIPPKFADRAPVNPESRNDKKLIQHNWRGAQGLAEDVRFYGRWMRDKAAVRVGHLYPLVEITADLAKDRPDLKPHVGRTLTVSAWLWARTVKSPNPAYAGVDVPLASTFLLSTKPGKEAYIQPIVEHGTYRFQVRLGKPDNPESTRTGTKLARGANFYCLLSGTPIAGDYIKDAGRNHRMGATLMAIVADVERGRVFLPPTDLAEWVARQATPEWKPEGSIVEDARAFTPTLYGLTKWSDLFSPRQLVALVTLSDLLVDVHKQVKNDALAGRASSTDGQAASDTATAYADTIVMYLACAISQISRYCSTLAKWNTTNQNIGQVFGLQALQMVWDYAEANTCQGALDMSAGAEWVANALLAVPARGVGHAECVSALHFNGQPSIISTDPPYFDNVPYADLSDFFYAWLRRSLRATLPQLFATVEVPKAEELVATSYRHGGKRAAHTFFVDGMTKAMRQVAARAHPAFPVTIYYAFKQSETDDDEGTASSGWETFLEAVFDAGLSIDGTWPVRTERQGRLRETGSNALASSIVLVCRPRPSDASIATRRDFVAALKRELRSAVAHLQRGNIAPVDLAQSAIGPGMAVFTRHAKVLDSKGEPIRVREALALINEALDEALVQHEGDFDADSRFALVWFDQHGFSEGEFGVADVLSRAKNTSVKGMEEAGILMQKGGRVRLFKPSELPAEWDPANDTRLTAWESVHHLVRALESGGEEAAANLARNLGSKAEPARELAYRLYSVCERKKRPAEALSYNALVQSWPEITRRAAEGRTPTTTQQEFI